MKQNYSLLVKNIDVDTDVLAYGKMLRTEWGNNAYYAAEHLQYFAKKPDKLKCFLFKKSDTPIVLMPFIYRQIHIKDKEYPYFDVISPYGYSGPLFNKTVTKEDLTVFWSKVDAWYRDNEVVTEFIRFSLNQNHTSYSGTVIKTLANVKGRLLPNFEDQWTAFLPKVRNNFRKAVNYNLRFQVFHNKEISKEVIKIFNDIYVDTMTRNNANKIYFFSFEYFENLILSNLDNFTIAVAYKENIPISVELIINYRDTNYAFLGGTNAEFFSHRPNDFLRVKIIEWAISQGKKRYVLGGGMKDGDGLYKSKKSFFPKDEDAIFCTGRKIVDQQVYDRLCLVSDTGYTDIPKDALNDSFFPYYRFGGK